MNRLWLGIMFTYISEGSGFVYGFMNFVDRICSGVTIILLQKLTPDVSANYNPLIKYYRGVLAFGCGASAISALIVTIILFPMKLGERLNDRSNGNATFGQRHMTEEE